MRGGADVGGGADVCVCLGWGGGVGGGSTFNF